MSRVYEALKKAEKERKKKTTGMKTSVNKRERTVLAEIVKAEKEVVADQVNELLVTLRDPLSHSADQFMKVGARMLQDGVQHDGQQRVVLITSALPREGKTMATANLAIGLASLPDTFVTLIDADLRKPELHKMLGISVDKGLSDYLEERADISEIYYDTPIPRLFIIPGDEAYSQPARILSSDKVQRLLEKLQAMHPKGYTIIDSTPMLLSPEFEILLNLVDSVIMVVRYGKTQKDSLQRALGLLDKKKIRGIIFNQTELNGRVSAGDYYRSR
jgi:capsular exopolysaccharide synthesis family protein